MMFCRNAGAFLVLLSSVAFAQEPPPCQRPLAHISHGDVSFSLSLDAKNPDVLLLAVPESDSTAQWRVMVRVRFRDNTTTEAALERSGAVHHDGTVDWTYYFDAKRPLGEGMLISVAVTVANDTFEVYPS